VQTAAFPPKRLIPKSSPRRPRLPQSRGKEPLRRSLYDAVPAHGKRQSRADARFSRVTPCG
jgi:hypothetical protein